jgi:hypothetical protein
VSWIKRAIPFHHKRYLSELAVAGQGRASTRNQALQPCCFDTAPFSTSHGTVPYMLGKPMTKLGGCRTLLKRLTCDY